MRGYTNIDAWKLADDLTVIIYEMTKAFPREELYGLASQLRRAASSWAANIVAGSARMTRRDYLHFLYIARACLAEAHYFVHLAKRLSYINDERSSELESLFRRAFACLLGLISAVEGRAENWAKQWPLLRVPCLSARPT